MNREFGLSPAPRLLRKSFRWRAQATIADREARKGSVRGSIAVTPGATVPRRVMLVDDVMTTGATLEECAAALKTAGADRVFALTLLKG